ncbi:MAG: DNA ligase (NAD(+)) LigA [Myxococcales bacterium FL481]|nr:MAG: DNA ligase (NAD(+)) LigA [Myxococcales bacterium FL481]
MTDEPLPTDPATIARDLATFDAATLVALVRRSNREYWDQAAPTLPDSLYDRLVNELRRRDPGAPILDDLGPTVDPALALGAKELVSLDLARKVAPERRLGLGFAHTRSMLSLEKCYELQGLIDWSDKFEGGILVMPKLDGIACSLHYDATGRLLVAATRGSGAVGEDITQNAQAIADIPAHLASSRLDGGLEVRGEIFMRLSVFQRFADTYSNPRNLTAGAIKNKDVERSREYDLSFMAYDVLGSDRPDERQKCALLGELGFSVDHFEFVDRGHMQAAFEAIAASRADLDYEIDGVVYRAELVAEQERLGETGHHPRWSIAYKFQGDTGQTKLADVMWSTSRTGTITPVARLEPVELSGAMIGRASLHNVSRFEALQLTRGCTVEVTRRGGVIPMVERVVEPGPQGEPFELPIACPGCGGPVERRRKREGEFLYCVDPTHCIDARLGELGHFAKVVEILGFGPKVLAKSVENGLLDHPDDFYRLRLEDLQTLDRLGRRSAQNLIDEIAARRKLTLPVFLQALGIDHLGRQNAQMLARQFATLDRIRTATRDELMAVRGVKEAIADALVTGLADKAALIDRLLEHVEVEAMAEPDPPASGPGPLVGKSFLFTGALEGLTRAQAQDRVKGAGGTAASGVAKTLDYLVVGAGKADKSSKQRKAEKLIEGGAAITILTEAEFLALVP